MGLNLTYWQAFLLQDSSLAFYQTTSDQQIAEEGRAGVSIIPVGKCPIFGQGHSDDIPSRINCRLLHRGENLPRLPHPNPDLPLLIPHHHNRPKPQNLPTLHHLTHPPHLGHALLEPVSDLLPLPRQSEAAGLLELRIHDIDVVAENADAAVGGAVDLLVGSGDLLLGLGGVLVEVGRGDVALGRGDGLPSHLFIWVEVVEEGGVDVLGLEICGRVVGGEGEGKGGIFESGVGDLRAGEERELGRRVEEEGEGGESRSCRSSTRHWNEERRKRVRRR